MNGSDDVKDAGGGPLAQFPTLGVGSVQPQRSQPAAFHGRRVADGGSVLVAA